MLEVYFSLDHGTAGAGERCINRAVWMCYTAADDREIFTLNLMTSPYGRENTGTDQMFGDNGQSGSIPVKTVCAAEDKWLSLLRVVPH